MFEISRTSRLFRPVIALIYPSTFRRVTLRCVRVDEIQISLPKSRCRCVASKLSKCNSLRAGGSSKHPFGEGLNMQSLIKTSLLSCEVSGQSLYRRTSNFWKRVNFTQLCI